MMKIKSGTAVILGVAAIMAIGWFFYRDYVPPRWLHDFGAEISTRATPDPDALPPIDAREAKPVAQPDHPYICFARLIPFAWDRLVIVPSHGDPLTIPVLRDAAWPGDHAADFAARMSHDPRYQLIVLLKDNRVVADALFYTFWGDLSALARPDGFTPDTAAFTAVVKNGTHILNVADPVPPICRGSP